MSKKNRTDKVGKLLMSYLSLWVMVSVSLKNSIECASELSIYDMKERNIYPLILIPWLMIVQRVFEPLQFSVCMHWDCCVGKRAANSYSCVLEQKTIDPWYKWGEALMDTSSCSWLLQCLEWKGGFRGCRSGHTKYLIEFTPYTSQICSNSVHQRCLAVIHKKVWINSL